jgi:uncharacterized protein (TIGR02145 family)
MNSRLLFKVVFGLMCLAAIGSAQTILWNQIYSDSGVSEAHSICQLFDGGFYAAGSVREPSGAIKAHSLQTTPYGGQVSLQRSFDGNAVIYDCKATFDHGRIVVGYVAIPTNNENLAIAKFDSTGNCMFYQNYNLPGSDRAFTVAQTPDSGYWFAGYTSAVNPGDTDIVGGCVFAGGTRSMSQGGGADVVIARLDASGTPLWARIYGGAGDDIAYNLTKTIDGGYALAGSASYFGQKAFLLKVDSLGKYQWAKFFGGISSDAGYGVVQLPNSGFMVAGNMPSYSADSSAVVIRTNANGDSVGIFRFRGYIAAGGSPLLLTSGSTVLSYTGISGSHTSVGIAMLGDTVMDIDGNVYHTVAIGTQTWMVENLKTTRYNDGSLIPLVTDYFTWYNLATPGYRWYNDDSATNKAPYGALYNWYTVNTGILAPAGWHVPTDSEWTTLTTFLGPDFTAGGKLKEAGLTHWLAPNYGATNETGFTALPGGCCVYNGAFDFMSTTGYWWSSTAYDASNSWYRGMGGSYASVYRGAGEVRYGFSVRCVKDDETNPPSAPVISAVITNDGCVILSWNLVYGAMSYNLYYQQGSSVCKACYPLGITLVKGVSSGYRPSGLTNGMQYAFVVSAVNAAGESEWSAAQTATPQGFTLQPADQSVIIGNTAVFSVASTGTGLSFEWQKNQTDIPGATSASYTTPAATFTDSGNKYRCLVSDGVYRFTSNEAILSVYPESAGPITITSQPQGGHQGKPYVYFHLSISAVSLCPLFYQWQKNGVDIPGETSSSISVNLGGCIFGPCYATYRCIVRNAVGTSVISDDATVYLP